MESAKQASNGRMYVLSAVALGVVMLATGAYVFATAGAQNAGQVGDGSYITTNQSMGIALALSVTPQDGPSGSAFQVNATVTNILRQANNLTGADSYNGVDFNPLCNSGPVTFEVLQGYYTLSDFRSGTVVNVHGPQNVMCTLTSLPLKYYVFEPDSAMFTGPLQSGSGSATRAAHLSVRVSQAWSHDFASHGLLSRGTYTVVGADAWGQLALVHFTVS